MNILIYSFILTFISWTLQNDIFLKPSLFTVQTLSYFFEIIHKSLFITFSRSLKLKNYKKILPVELLIDITAERNKILRIWDTVLLSLFSCFKQIFLLVTFADIEGTLNSVFFLNQKRNIFLKIFIWYDRWGRAFLSLLTFLHFFFAFFRK